MSEAGGGGRKAEVGGRGARDASGSVEKRILLIAGVVVGAKAEEVHGAGDDGGID